MFITFLSRMLRLTLLLFTVGFTFAINNYTFPSDFIFGVSTAAYQIEGAWNYDGGYQNPLQILMSSPLNVGDESHRFQKLNRLESERWPSEPWNLKQTDKENPEQADRKNAKVVKGRDVGPQEHHMWYWKGKLYRIQKKGHEWHLSHHCQPP
ncbi:hypothetical protein C0J52_03307 [Blattella germanica]|nr:hypothetical protein C0J52_03307 [Blattella germanica]